MVWSKYVVFVSLEGAKTLDHIMRSKSRVELSFTLTSTTLTAQMTVVKVYPPLEGEESLEKTTLTADRSHLPGDESAYVYIYIYLFRLNQTSSP